MNKFILTLSGVLFFISSFGQTKVEKETATIVDEGRRLYRSEMASWYGTDLFLEKFKDKVENIGGYFSYTENDISKCIFFSKGEAPKVIGTISFDSTYNVGTAKMDGSEREFTPIELELYQLRTNAKAAIKGDTLFKYYENTEYNFIPVVDNSERKVYVLTGPKNNGVVIFGNDYLLTFDKNCKLLQKKRLHQNIITINSPKGDTDLITMHSHLPETGDFITSTDICTLMLYEKLARWKQHIVISENYVCLWDCKTDQLAVLTKKAWDNIYKDSQKRHKN